MSRQFAERIEDVNAPRNMAKIEPWLYRGADASKEKLDFLKQLGIKTVINFRYWGSIEKDVAKAGMTPVSIPLIADFRGSEAPTEDQLRYFFYLLNDKSMHPIYFHCMHGCDRTGTMAACYRIEQGWTPEEAIEEMQHFGFHDNWVDFMKFVKTYTPRGYLNKEK